MDQYYPLNANEFEEVARTSNPPLSYLRRLPRGMSPGEVSGAVSYAYYRYQQNNGHIDTLSAQLVTPASTDLPKSSHATSKLIVPPRLEVDPVHTEDLSGRQETIVIADIHVPLDRPDLLLYIAQKHEGARLVVAGDIVNFDNYSKFLTVNHELLRFPEWKYTGKQCVDMAVEAIANVQKYWQDITLIFGNHDNRLAKKIADTANGDASFVKSILQDPFRAIPNVIIPDKTTWDFYMHKCGDAWIGHWGFCGKPTCAGAKKSVEHMLSRREVREQGEWNVLVQAHTHKVGDALDYIGKRVMECGSLTRIPDYMDGGMGKGHEPELGYVHLVQYDGRTCNEESRAVPFDNYYYTHYKEVGPYKGRVYFV